jgi:hypothetical protein
VTGVHLLIKKEKTLVFDCLSDARPNSDKYKEFNLAEKVPKKVRDVAKRVYAFIYIFIALVPS